MQSTKRVQSGAQASSSHRPDEAASSGEVDYLEVAGHAHFSVSADAVGLTVRVESGKLVADASAFEAVDELASLRNRLRKDGASGFTIDEFEGRGKSGLLGSGTEARYRVRVECPMGSLSAILLGVAKEKNATLASSSWRFPDDVERLREATADAARDARGDAAGLAAALGVELGVPHRVLHHHWAEDSSESPVPRGSKTASIEDQYVRLAAERTIHTKVVLRYRMK